MYKVFDATFLLQKQRLKSLKLNATQMEHGGHQRVYLNTLTLKWSIMFRPLWFIPVAFARAGVDNPFRTMDRSKPRFILRTSSQENNVWFICYLAV